MFKRVDKILQARQQEANDLNEEAKTKAIEAENSKLKYENELNALNSQKEEMLRQSKDDAYREHEKIISDARSQAVGILDEAKVNARLESERQKKIYEAELKEMVVDAASKIAATSHSEEYDKLLYDKFIEESKGVNNGSNEER